MSTLNPPHPAYIAPLTPEQILLFAPMVTFHPAEEHFPCSIEHLLTNAKLRRRSDPAYEKPLHGNPANLGDGDQGNVEEWFVEIDSAQYKGATPDQGKIHPPMYVSVQFNGPYIDINYFFLYAFQGSQTVNVLAPWPVNHFLATAHSYARHEGDLECVTVRVFANQPDYIIAVGYEQHGSKHWYASGEYEAVDNTQRPIVRAALNGHASYNGKGMNHGGNDWITLEETFGLNIVDVVRPGAGVVWDPAELVLIGRDDAGKPLTDAAWVTFCGRFGRKFQNSLQGVTNLQNGSLSWDETLYVTTASFIAELANLLPKDPDLVVGNGPGAFGSRPSVRLHINTQKTYFFIQSRLDPRLVLTCNSVDNPQSILSELQSTDEARRDRQLWSSLDWDNRGFLLVNKATGAELRMTDNEKPLLATMPSSGLGDSHRLWRHGEGDNGEGFRAMRTYWSEDQCADIQFNKPDPGTLIQSSRWHAGGNQQWRFVPDSTYNIRPLPNTDFAVYAAADGKLRLKRCSADQAKSDPTVQWRLIRSNTDTFVLINPASNTGAYLLNKAGGQPILLAFPDHEHPPRPWNPHRIGASEEYEVRISGLDWDAYGGVVQQDTEVWAHEINGGDNQKWRFYLNGSGAWGPPLF
jgi:hypothetical protein